MVNIIPIIHSSDNAPQLAQNLKGCGVSRILLVDSEASRGNSPVRCEPITAIAPPDSHELRVAFGGGIKTRDVLRKVIEAGADKIVCSTIAVMQPTVFAYWIECFGSEAVWLALNMKEGKLLLNGGRRSVEKPIDEPLKILLESGLKTVIINMAYDDVATTLKYCSEVAAKFPRLKIIPGFNLNSIDEVKASEEAGFKTVVMLNPLEESKLTIEDFKKYYTKPKEEREDDAESEKADSGADL